MHSFAVGGGSFTFLSKIIFSCSYFSLINVLCMFVVFVFPKTGDFLFLNDLFKVVFFL